MNPLRMRPARMWTLGPFVLLAAAATVSASTLVGWQGQTTEPMKGSQRPGEYLEREVRHQLLLLPYYTVFDHLEYKVEGYRVTLYGEVTRPTLKSDAERAVKHIEGVESVVNNIEVLPVSPNDDRIRRAEYRAIYGTQGLDRYAMQAVPSIHIIVKNGNVTLVGVVNNEADRNIAGIKANGVPGVFSVKNELRIEKD